MDPTPQKVVFHEAAEGAFDIVVALYHDQGHTAGKMLDLNRTVSLSLGLPLLKTSVDHNAAFGMAEKGFANPAGMIEAINKAAVYARRFRCRYQ